MSISEIWVKRLNFSALFLAAFLAPFLLFAYGYLFEQVRPMNDVLLYGYWLQQIQFGNPVFGISQDFVYPYPALAPMLLAKLFGGQSGILVGWATLVALLNSLAVGTLTAWGRAGKSAKLAALFWVSFLLLLGPAGVARIDAISAAVAVFGLVALSKDRIVLAISLFTFGAWIKIWPVALAVSAFISAKKKLLVVYAAVLSVAAVLTFALAAGANSSLFSFIFKQGSRGIQIESPIAMIWIWAAKFGVADTGIYYDKEIITNQVYGSQVELISFLMTPAMFFALAITVLLGYRAIRAGADRNQVFAAMSLTAVLDLIVFNKVGSPQFMAWLAIPMMALILFKAKKLWLPITGLLLIAFTTNLIYPILYIDLMGLGDLSVVTLTLRNLLLIAMLVHANLRLGELSKKKSQPKALA